MVEPIRIKDQFSLISGTKSIQDDTNIVSADDGGDDSDIAEPDPDDPDAIEDFEVWEERNGELEFFQINCSVLSSVSLNDPRIFQSLDV